MKPLFASADMGLRQNTQPLHNHAYAELYVSLSGHAVNVINDKESETMPLDVYVLTRDMMHGQLQTRAYRYCIFKFDLDALHAQATELMHLPTYQSLFIVEPQLRRQGALKSNLQIDSLTAEYAALTAQLLAQETDRTLCDTLFYSLISAIVHNAHPRIHQSPSYTLMAEAASYMETHYAEPLCLESLSEMAHYSRRHFTRLFRMYYHMSPMEYLNQIRLRRAATQLTDSNSNLSRIAENCGFINSSMFSKHFRTMYGMSPSAYRKKIQIMPPTTSMSLKSAAIIEPN